MSDSIDTRPQGDAAWPTASAPAPAAPAPAADEQELEHQLSPEQAWIAGGAGSGETRYGPARLVLIVAAVILGGVLFGPYVLIIIGALLVSVILHEFGHFGMARLCGMKATEFFIGFGPRLWSFRRGETEYGLKLLPAGAYVRIIGMNNLEEVDPADEPRSYRAQSAPKRVATVLAGPAMNLLIAFVLLFGLFLVQGRPSDDLWTVNEVVAPSAASEGGVLAGDRIVSVDGVAVGAFDGFDEVLNAKAGQQVDMVVLRDGQEVTLHPTLGWRLNDEAAAAIPSTPALESSDIIASVDGQPVATYDDFRSLLATDGDPVTVRVERGTGAYDLTVERPLTLPASAATGFLGVRPQSTFVRESPIGALAETGRLMGEVTTGTFASFGRLLSPSGIQNYAGQIADSTTGADQQATEAHALRPVDGAAAAVSSDEVQERPISIVGIVQFGSGAAEAGWFELLSIVALVNIALALINLLPVLPFDGGHAAIGIYEGIRGKIQGRPYRADITKMMPVVYGVFGLLLLLGLSSILLDILRPVSYGG